jgi:flagellar operon protein
MEIGRVGSQPSSQPPSPAGKGAGPGFADVLARELTFSGHAEKRLASRGIELSSDDLGRLSEGVSKADAKGSQTALLLLRDLSFIVNVKNRTVVTALDQRTMKDGVITQIDSTVLL